MSLYRLIDEESDRQPVSRLCRTLGVTRSGYYDWQRQPLSDRALADWLDRQPWRSVEDVRAVFEWIETWYNRRRRHSSLGYLSPLEFESQRYDGHTISNP